MNGHEMWLCQCGHPRAAHEHLRRGSDCSLCAPGSCLRFRSTTSVWQRIAALTPWHRRDALCFG